MTTTLNAKPHKPTFSVRNNLTEGIQTPTVSFEIKMVDTSGLAALALVGLSGYLFFTKVTRGDPLGFLIWVYFVLQANLSFGWLALNRFIDHVFLTPNEKNKIVVIGDGIAAGFWDWITTGQNAGLTRRLKDKIAADESLLLRWKVFNCGHFATISDEWLPNYLRAPMYMPLINGFIPCSTMCSTRGA